MIPVESENLVAIGWEALPTSMQRASSLTPDDEKIGILQIEFKQATYVYMSVPWMEFDALLNAASKGGYFHQHIKDNYEWEQVA